MPKLYDLQELVELTGLPERTIRYYLAKVLETPSGTRGRKAFYSQETLDQLKLAKQILTAPYDPKRGEIKPSLRDFQHWLNSHTAEEIREMAAMPYRIKPKALLAASASEVLNLSSDEAAKRSVSPSEPISQSIGKEDKENNTDTAAQYLDRVMGTDRRTAPRPGNRHLRQTPWESFQFGNDLEIKVRKQLTPGQKQQLRLAGRLLQSVLEKE